MIERDRIILEWLEKMRDEQWNKINHSEPKLEELPKFELVAEPKDDLGPIIPPKKVIPCKIIVGEPKDTEKCQCDRTSGYNITGTIENGRCIKVICNICGKETKHSPDTESVSEEELEKLLNGYFEEEYHTKDDSGHINYVDGFVRPEDIAKALLQKYNITKR